MQVTVVAVVEEEVAAVEEEVAAAAAGAAVVMTMMMTMMTMMMMTMTTMTTVHLLAELVRPVATELDAGFSTIKRWNSNWLKSCKINARWRRDDALLASRPPIPSQPRIRMDAVLS